MYSKSYIHVYTAIGGLWTVVNNGLHACSIFFPLLSIGVTLISKNLSAVLEATWEARAEYYQLGLCMGLSGNDMDAINANNRGQVGACWTQTLKKCINRGLTQDELVKALCSTTVGMNEVAIRIRQMTF